MEKQFNSKGQIVHKEATIFTQEAVNYTMLSTSSNEACANCIFYRSTGFDGIEWPHCHIVENWPDAIEPTGYCDEWREKPEPPPDMTEMIVEAVTEAAETMSESMMTVEMDLGKELEKPGILERIAKALRPYLQREDAKNAFSVFKGTDGAWHWHAIFTNNYEDLDAEIISEKAHENYVNRVDMGLIPMPELWAWHTVGTKHGQATAVWYDNHFMHAVGDFDDTPDAKKAIVFYQKNAGKVKLSHGFTSPVWAFKDGIYEDYNTFEITTLPPYAAANPYTQFEEFKTMALTDEKRRYLEGMFGKDKLAQIEAADGERSKALEELNVAYKDYAATSEAAKPVENTGYAQAYLDLSQGQSEIINLMQLQTKALQDRDSKIETLGKQISDQQKQLDELRTTLNQPPRRASQDESTLDTKLKDALPGDDKAAKFWGVPLKAGS